MDMVEIAVEELQFDLDLINLLFAEPAMEDGYVGDANGGSGGSSGSGNGDAKSASSDSKGGDDKKETSNSTANDNKSDDKKDDDKDKKDGKVKSIDLDGVSKEKITKWAKDAVEEYNSKLKDDEKLNYVSYEIVGKADIEVKTKRSEGSTELILGVLVQSKDGDPNASEVKYVIHLVDAGDENLQNLKAMDKDALDKKIKAKFSDKAKVLGFRNGGKTAWVETTGNSDEKDQEYRFVSLTVKPEKWIVNSEKDADPKMYDANKNREEGTNRTLIDKIDSFFKMIWEMIERAIAQIKEKFARCASGQKSFAKEIEKIKKEKKKPNYDIKVKNYIYDDNVIHELEKVLSTNFDGLRELLDKVELTESGVNMNGVLDDTSDAAKKSIDNIYLLTAEDMGIKGEIGGAGDFFNAVRRMYRGSEEIVEFRLGNKDSELDKAEDFVKRYDDEFKKVLDAIDKTKRDFEPYKRKMERIRSVKLTGDDAKDFESWLKMCGQQYTVIINCYTFIGSLLQERLYNCRNLFRRAYGLL